MRGATDARRAWGLREAELKERVEGLQRLVDAHGRLEKLEYLRAVVLKYFELGPGSFDELFPLLCAFLDFSPDEQRRIKDGHLAHIEGSDPASLWGLLGSGPTSLPPSATMALPPFPMPSLALASPTLAPLTPAPITPASSAPASSFSAANDPEMARSNGAADEQAKADKEKLARMKKLLAAADKRLAQAQATIQERDARIQRLISAARDE